MIRPILLLIVLGGLTLFALQNFSTALPLVFLGLKSVTLPLSVWVTLAIAAGFLTALVMAALFQLSNYLTEQQLRSLLDRQNIDKPRSSRKSQSPSTSNATPGASSSYREDSNRNEYFEEEEDEEDVEETFSGRDRVKNRDTYERPQEPKTRSQSGSVYSYSYQEPSDSSVGQTESVYDADYRVITPPLRQPNKIETDWGSKKNPSDEDWGFEDDDEFDDDRGKEVRR